MKRNVSLAVIAALALSTTSSFATNGVNMIGQGAQSRSMGGVGIAKSFGAASALANPALLSSVEKSEFTAAVTFFMPDVAARSDYTGANGSFEDSDADFSVIPEMYYASRINANLVYGITLAGTAGMGTDYADTTATSANVANMQTELTIAKIAIPVAYSMNSFTLGLAPILQYGTLEVDNAAVTKNKAADIGLGYELGMSYNVSKGFVIAAIYKSKITMTYKDVLSRSLTAFGVSSTITSGDNLDQPAEYGMGISYRNGCNTFAFDYKNIQWASAAGYKDFAWDDQDVYAFGYEYATSTWALRAGYNYAKSPISEQDGSTLTGATQNFFNLTGFPGIVESHYTLGAGYNISEGLSLDMAMIYAEKTKESFGIAAYGGSTVDIIHSQLGLTVAATYKF